MSAVELIPLRAVYEIFSTYYPLQVYKSERHLLPGFLRILIGHVKLLVAFHRVNNPGVMFQYVGEP
jgi:hypothetical protein